MYNEDYLKHYGVKGMKWGFRRRSQENSIGVGARKTTTTTMQNTAEKLKKAGTAIGSAVNKGVDKAKTQAAKSGNTEIAKRGKAAIDVLMNGDTDWMGRRISDNDLSTELRNRGKAALERLMYSEKQIDNKKFFGDYNF